MNIAHIGCDGEDRVLGYWRWGKGELSCDGSAN